MPVTHFDGDRGPLGPPPTAFRFPERRAGFRRFGRALPFIAVAAALIVLYVIASIGKDIYADLLWFDSVGYRSVYTTRIDDAHLALLRRRRHLPRALRHQHPRRAPPRALGRRSRLRSV